MSSRDDNRDRKVPVPRIQFLNSRDVPRNQKKNSRDDIKDNKFLSLEFNFGFLETAIPDSF